MLHSPVFASIKADTAHKQMIWDQGLHVGLLIGIRFRYPLFGLWEFGFGIRFSGHWNLVPFSGFQPRNLCLNSDW